MRRSVALKTRYGRWLVSAELLKNPNVRLVAQQIGRAEQFDDTPGVHTSEIHVDLKPLGGSAAEQVETEIRETLDKIPGASFATKTFLAERMEEVVSEACAQGQVSRLLQP